MILTTQEFTCALDELLDLFANAEYSQMNYSIWRIRKGISKRDADMIWLWVNALDTWDHTDGAVNYMTEEQMMNILTKSNMIRK